MADQNEVYLPVGRYVSGDLLQKRTKDNRNLPIAEDKQRYEFGVAIPKTDPSTATFFQQLQAAAHQAFVGKPTQAMAGPAIDQWFQTMSGFSMKVSDGDKVAASTGKANPNTQGCFVVWFSSMYPTSCFLMNGQPVDAAQIKRGYFVDAMCGIAANTLPPGDGMGIYMNPNMLRFARVGEEITGGPDFAGMMSRMPTPPGIDPNATPLAAPPVGVAPMQPGQAPAPQMPGQAPAPQMQQPAPQMPGQAPAPQMQQPAPQMPGQAPQMPGQAPVGNPPGLPGMTPQSQSGAPTGTTSPTSGGHPAHPGIMPGNGGLPGAGQ